MPSYYKFRCEVCGYTGIRYRNVKRCPACGEHELFRFEPRPGPSAAAVLDVLADLFNEMQLSPEEIDDELRQIGYDPDELSGRFREIVEPLLERKEREINEATKGL